MSFGSGLLLGSKRWTYGVGVMVIFLTTSYSTIYHHSSVVDKQQRGLPKTNKTAAGSHRVSGVPLGIGFAVAFACMLRC